MKLFVRKYSKILRNIRFVPLFIFYIQFFSKIFKMNENLEKEISKNKRNELDHQLDIANQKLLFKMLDYIINFRRSQSVEISNCNSAPEAIDKINIRINYLESRINILKQQYDAYAQLNNQNLKEHLVKNQEQILQRINNFTSEKEDLTIKIPQIKSESSYYNSNIEKVDEKIKLSKNDNDHLKQMNESALQKLNLIQQENEVDQISSKMLEQDSDQVSNFDMFVHFVESIIEK